MTVNQLIIAEFEARKRGDVALANALQAQRWSQVMGTVVNSENLKKRD